jgi:hypothetical protein
LPDGERKVAARVCLDEPLLVGRAGANGKAVVAVDYDLPILGGGVDAVFAQSRGERLFDHFGRYVSVLRIVVEQPSHLAFEGLDIGLGAEHLDRIAAGDDLHARRERGHAFEICAVRTEQVARRDALDRNLLCYRFIHNRQNNNPSDSTTR